MASNSYGKSGLSTDVLDFTEAAEKTIHSVVHVKMFPNHGKQSHIRIFFMGIKAAISGTSGTGSGVIISEDGYIVTNNHVIKDASVEITLNNKKSYKSKTYWNRF
jgi:S1-C subfamily serine protease